MPALDAERLSGQAILIALMGFAFAAIILARLTGGGVPAGAGEPSPTPQETSQASASSASTDRPTATVVATAPAVSSAAPGASATPASPRPSTTGTRTYKVKAGDTMIGIAARFGTTTKAILKLNGITKASNLKVGQVLQIP